MRRLFRFNLKLFDFVCLSIIFPLMSTIVTLIGVLAQPFILTETKSLTGLG